MKNNVLDTAVALSDEDLLARIEALAGTERETTAVLVAHLAALEMRPSLYAALGYGSLFDYCTQALRLSEDAACTRIRAARTCRSFPMVLDLLSSGAVSLTAVRLLQPHLTAENHEAVLARATHKRREEVEALVAELAPRPDVPSSVRKLPTRPMSSQPSGPSLIFGEGTTDRTAVTAVPPAPAPSVVPGPGCPAAATPMTGQAPESSKPLARLATPAGPRSVVRASAPERYRVQFTIGQDTHDKLRRLQALMRREIPTGDVAVIFDQAVDLMLERVERAKLGAKAKDRSMPGSGSGDRAYENRIRFRTDRDVRSEAGGVEDAKRAALKRSRHVPNPVKRAVWCRDGGRCAFVSAGGHRCTERAFLELHHIRPWALEGPATAGNLSLRCRRHNAYEAELVFGARRLATVREGG